MDLDRFIAELHVQLEKINEAISSLERLTPAAPPRGRGRPRKQATGTAEKKHEARTSTAQGNV